MECFEIVKYPSYNYDENGIYTKNEWTSISDIGRYFEGKKFTLLEYLSTEQKYINVVERILEIIKCRYVCISYMELDEEDSLRKILRRNLDVKKTKKDNSDVRK